MNLVAKKRLDIELMRIIAAFFVLYNHTGANGFSKFLSYDPHTFHYWLYLFLSISCKVSVPLFLVIAGALMLGREPEPVKYGFQSDKLVGDEGYEFPIFRSELFPEYNSDDKIGGNKVFNPDDIKLENQEKIDEHLAKEEALLKETDELLARLGIELGTKYYSGSDYFTKEQFEEDHEAVKRMDASINQKQDKKTKEDNSRFKLR